MLGEPLDPSFVTMELTEEEAWDTILEDGSIDRTWSQRPLPTQSCESRYETWRSIKKNTDQNYGSTPSGERFK